MLLEPSNKWYWQYDLAAQSIIIQLSDGLAMSCQLDKCNMNEICKGKVHFTADDSSFYYYIIEAIKDLTLSDAQKTQLALNAVTNYRFHKIKMPQSWFFNFQAEAMRSKVGDLVTLSTADDSFEFIVLESDERVATCMLIQAQAQLSYAKCLQQFEVIRVMNNRVALTPTAQIQSPADILRAMRIQA